MNERIKELKHQAFRWYDKNIPEHCSYENRCGDAWEDKFAELLIQEAAAFVSGAAEVYNQAEQDACVRASKGLKKYFGVKE